MLGPRREHRKAPPRTTTFQGSSPHQGAGAGARSKPQGTARTRRCCCCLCRWRHRHRRLRLTGPWWRAWCCAAASSRLARLLDAHPPVLSEHAALAAALLPPPLLTPAAAAPSDPYCCCSSCCRISLLANGHHAAAGVCGARLLPSQTASQLLCSKASLPAASPVLHPLVQHCAAVGTGCAAECVEASPAVCRGDASRTEHAGCDGCCHKRASATPRMDGSACRHRLRAGAGRRKWRPGLHGPESPTRGQCASLYTALLILQARVTQGTRCALNVPPH